MSDIEVRAHLDGSILSLCVTHWFAPLEVPRILGNFQKLHHINESSGIMAKIHPYAHATAYEGCMTTCMLLI
jgi:hypothetical protein